MPLSKYITGAYSPEEFLKMANEQDDEDDHPRSNYSWAKPVDLILFGTCSSGNGHGYFAHAVAGYGKPNRDFFAPVLERHNPKTVVLIAECCGEYNARFQSMLRDMFPAIEWIVPWVHDYCESPWVYRVVPDLVSARLLIEERQSAPSDGTNYPGNHCD